MSTSPESLGERPRPDRFSSHALVEIRRVRFLPIFCRSGILLDISSAGFKIEYTGESHSRIGDVFWLSIPLAPLGIYSPSRLMIKGECRWFDSKRYRLGGVFLDVNETSRLILDQVIESLRRRGFLARTEGSIGP